MLRRFIHESNPDDAGKLLGKDGKPLKSILKSGVDINGINKSGVRATDEAKQGMNNSYLINDNPKKRSINPPYLATRKLKPSVQVNKMLLHVRFVVVPTTLNIAWKSEQAFFDYAFSRTNEAGGLVPNFMASQDSGLSKFESDLKQQQSEVTNKIDTLLKAINDQMMGALPSDTVENPKLNVNYTSKVLSARSYSQMEDPQRSSNPFQSVNAIITCFKLTNILPKDQQQTKIVLVNEIETPKPKQPENSLEDEFKDLHLNLPVLEVLAHAPV
ncbi:hypothetical protein Tco_0189143 [Tanacetum coccineum]